MMTDNESPPPVQHRDSRVSVQRTVRRLLLGTALMFGFAFALVPLYDVFCDLVGINGKTDGQRYVYQPRETLPDPTRQVTVQLIAVNNSGMPWQFKPAVTEISLSPGEIINTYFFARNNSGKRMVAQAIPSVSPGLAAEYLKKTECFCFERQVLDVGESRELGLRFYLDPELPKSFKKLTLSYTLFDVTELIEADGSPAALN